MSNKEFAEKFIKAENAAWLEGNVNALDEVEDSNVTYHMTPPISDVTGREAHKQFIKLARMAFSNIRIEVKYLVDSGDLVAFTYHSEQKYTGTFPGSPPGKGQQVTNDELWLFRLKDGKAVEVWMYGTIRGIT